MSLRVLLADESLTIKKVMDLALQDYMVQVKTVPSGLDVLDVALEFKPEIIFIDVLLAKKSGYDVAAEIAKNEALKGSPCVLMWSGFIEVDPKRVEAAGVAATLEKPFDADQLRKLVKNLVPRLKSNKISDFLNFSDLPPLIEDKALIKTGTQKKASMDQSDGLNLSGSELNDLEATQPLSASNETSPVGLNLSGMEGVSPAQNNLAEKGSLPGLNLKSLRKDAPPSAAPSFAQAEEFDDFLTVPLPGTKRKDAFSNPDVGNKTLGSDLLENWEPKKISELSELSKEEKVPELNSLNKELLIEMNSPVLENQLTPKASTQSSSVQANPNSFRERIDEIKGAILLGDSGDEVPIEDLDDYTPVPDHIASSQIKVNHAPPPSTLDPIRAEEILREQASRIIEDIAWKIIPDVAERIIRQEIQKLLEDLDRMKKRNP
jgi:DNA-binding response OmpR family regulator